jgi:hypothetical protein
MKIICPQEKSRMAHPLYLFMCLRKKSTRWAVMKQPAVLHPLQRSQSSLTRLSKCSENDMNAIAYFRRHSRADCWNLDLNRRLKFDKVGKPASDAISRIERSVEVSMVVATFNRNPFTHSSGRQPRARRNVRRKVDKLQWHKSASFRKSTFSE